MSQDCIVLSSPLGWSVKSQKCNEFYDVVVNNESCSCSLKCEKCRAHPYTEIRDKIIHGEAHVKHRKQEAVMAARIGPDCK